VHTHVHVRVSNRTHCKLKCFRYVMLVNNNETASDIHTYHTYMHTHGFKHANVRNLMCLLFVHNQNVCLFWSSLLTARHAKLRKDRKERFQRHAHEDKTSICNHARKEERGLIASTPAHDEEARACRQLSHREHDKTK
jgi:hypothetical protein